jgi:glycosyltransferase involved in cell wall biosynthesis
MLFLVYGLSGSNLSGQHILRGQLPWLAKWTRGRHEWAVLYPAGHRDHVADLGPNVRWIECPAYTARWYFRSLWDTFFLPDKAKGLGADLLYTPTGFSFPRVRIPQVVLAPNPWCLVPGLKRSGTEQIKAGLQRRAYRQAMRQAACMVFISTFMQTAYRANAGHVARLERVIPIGIDDDAFAASAGPLAACPRKPHQILSVSAMAPHKGVETVVRALKLLREEFKLTATLELVGAWPDASYATTICGLVADLGLASQVSFRGRVTRQDLLRYYAESKVFCLMSNCESFGIPAVEAQAFGTPVVSSNCCAIPEVCGDGGLLPDPGDAQGSAKALHELLSNPSRWEEMSRNARQNAARYRWETCTKPLLEILHHSK